MADFFTHIRDPIHGAIHLNSRERSLVDSPAFQRLRNIKQLGFADFAFPGATHSRFSHSLGAMHLAGRLFDQVFFEPKLTQETREFFRQCLRLAMMFHDVGHPPLSHTTEMFLPQIEALGLKEPHSRKATHEDYTQKLLLDSSLGEALRTTFRSEGITPEIIVSLLKPADPMNCFKEGPLDYAPILRQIISSEIDADRMDYLLRDSFFCGVNYGKFDLLWLIDNLIPIEKNGQVFLGLKSRGLFAFEDFLLSRYHMFNSVYFHHTPVIYQKMLERYFKSSPTELVFSAELESYMAMDDMDVWMTLRKSQNPWAKRIVQRKPYLVLNEWHHNPQGPANPMPDKQELLDSLKQSGIDVLYSEHRCNLSKYFPNMDNPIYVEMPHRQILPLEQASHLFVRYQEPIELVRLYVPPEQKDAALYQMSLIRTAYSRCGGLNR